MILDPLGDTNAITSILGQELTNTLNSDLNRNFVFQLKSFEHQLQSNGNDCGPLVCGYVIKISQKNMPLNIDIEEIRSWVYFNAFEPLSSLSNSGGGYFHNNSNLVALKSIQNFDKSHLMRYLSEIVKASNLLVLNADFSANLAKCNEEFIRENISFRQFIGKDLVICPFVDNSKWIIFVFNQKNRSSYIIDTSSKFLDKSLLLVGISLNKNFNSFYRNNSDTETLFSSTPPSHDVSVSCSKSGLLACGIIERIIYNQPLDNIKIHPICNKLISLMSIPRKIDVHINPSAKPVLSLHQRLRNIADLFASLQNSSSDEIENSLTDYILITRKISSKKINCSNRLRNQRAKFDFSLRKKFKHSPKAVFDLIKFDSLVTVSPDRKDIEDFFRLKSTAPPDTEWDTLPHIRHGPNFSFEIIDQSDLLEILNSMSVSSPGSSNVTYRDIKFCDPRAQLLCLLFNRILSTGIIPKRWKTYSTLLIPKPHKDGHYNKISSWRPIALLECTYKLFTACLTKHIETWVSDNNLAFPLQKGTGKSEGCTEHNNILRCMLEDYGSKKSLHIAYLDISDAFGSIPIRHIIGILRLMGMSSSATDLVSNLYEDCSSSYICSNIVTSSIMVNRGVRQGCPLSMLLFNIGLDPILSECSLVSNAGARIGSFKVECLAYADDLALFAENPVVLQKMVNTACFWTNWSGMSFNPSKCGHMATINHSTSILVNNVTIPNILYSILTNIDTWASMLANLRKILQKICSKKLSLIRTSLLLPFFFLGRRLKLIKCSSNLA